MATEPFLINPPSVLPRRLVLSRRLRMPMKLKHRSYVAPKVRRRVRIGRLLPRYNPVGETLVTIGANPYMKLSKRLSRYKRKRSFLKLLKGRFRSMYNDNYRKWTRKEKEAQRRLIMEIKPWLKRGKRKASASASSVTVLPRKRKWKKTVIAIPARLRVANPHRCRRAYDNAWYGQPRRHSKAAKLGWKRRRRHDNPRRYYRRRYYRNPAVTVGGIFSDVMDVGNWLPIAVSGGIGITATAVLPNMIASNLIAQPMYGQFVKYGIQLVSAFGGGALVSNFVGKKHGDAWMVTSVAYVGYQVLRDFVFKPFLPQFAVGLGEYEQYYSSDEPYQTVSGGTGYGVNAFPEAQMSAFPEAQMSAYPYDGQYGY